MDTAHVKALVADLQTTLRLLDDLIAELYQHQAEWAGCGRLGELIARLAVQPHLVELPALLLCAHAEIAGIRDGIRQTRAALEAHAVERLRDSQSLLSDVAATTEHATLALLNGLDRSLELITSLEAEAQGKATASGLAALRHQVEALYHHLQFQDIAAQQLQGVTHSLLDLEVRVSAVATLFDRTLGAGPEPAPADPPAPPLAYNPHATMRRTEADQALIDQTFEGARHGHPADRAVQPGV